ncbi:MAG TPA: UbiA family prenyltransferase [Candidatus Borkfalkia excrementavium]|uniref:UbiA family prenyltransferase n=1 Tax=Candidatus Borkfalkia excrementavium TaxID=2838505 RepID=A0A9D1Z7M4_9FIRM|nr:UbiA family prenyltransferase [Candidatus Borkfalkia excrementavium]
MYKILRMVFAIIAAVLVASCIFVALYVSMLAFWCVIGGALLSFALSMFFKYLQEEKESKEKQTASPAAEEESKPDQEEDKQK